MLLRYAVGDVAGITTAVVVNAQQVSGYSGEWNWKKNTVVLLVFRTISVILVTVRIRITNERKTDFGFFFELLSKF